MASRIKDLDAPASLNHTPPTTFQYSGRLPQLLDIVKDLDGNHYTG